MNRCGDISIENFLNERSVIGCWSVVNITYTDTIYASSLHYERGVGGVKIPLVKVEQQQMT